ncbi:MAG: NnrS family protein [Kangiellaceae bacterium]|nr:NnrS family protein [Kangiellaceae bacterium]
MINISEPSNKKFALFELGFRPFFLLSALLAAFFVVGWGLFYSGSSAGNIITNVNYYPSLMWHSHEMVFGYTSAVIAGFVLTAVTNWTGQMTIKNTALAVLVLLWLLARILPFVTNSGWLIASTDLLFYPYLSIAVAKPIIQTGNKRNLFIIAILTFVGLANLLVHLQLLNLFSDTAKSGLYFGLYIQLLLIVIFAGRVFPFFTGRGVKVPFEPRKEQWLEVSSIASFALFAASDLLHLPSTLILVLGISAVLLNCWRLVGWYNHQIWKVPLLWVLHLGYLFLILGILLKAMGTVWPALTFPALHAMTVGGLGMITLGMMARVSLGHTGRSIHQPPKSISWMFILVALACLIRVFVPLAFSQYYVTAILVSSILWSLAFLWFAVIYTPYWIKPRVDGLPG